MSAPRLRTPRLGLRPATLQDVESLHALWIQPNVRRWLFDDVEIPLETARGIVAESASTWRSRGYGLLVLDATGNPLVGFCGLRDQERSDRPELLYGVAERSAGRGLATEASFAVLAHAFGRVGLACVEASVDEPNVASVRVLEKLGMSRTDRRLVEGRPTLYYELAREAFPGECSETHRAPGPG